jgi:Flp pilus assembly protein TadD
MRPIRTTVLVFFITTFLSAIVSPGTGFGETAESQALSLKASADGHLRRGDTALAIGEYKKALALTPSSTALYFNLAVAYFSQKNLKDAAAALEKLVELDPQDVEAHYNLGCLYLYERDLVKAKTHLEKARLCCERDVRFEAPVRQSEAFIGELEKLDPLARELVFLLIQRDLGTTL